MAGIASETIPFGALVLCRGFVVALASADVANGTAKPRPQWKGEPPAYAAGEHVRVEPIEGLGQRSLHALANAPIMEPSRIYLPAGKVSMADARAREAMNMRVDEEEPRP